MLKVVRSKNIPVNEYIPQKKSGTYWERTGKFQKDYEEISTKILERCQGLNLWLKLDRDEIPETMLLMNALKVIYCAKYVDGLNGAETILKYRVHGFRTVESFKEFCKTMTAYNTIRYLEHSSTGNLEKAMDEAIKIYQDLV